MGNTIVNPCICYTYTSPISKVSRGDGTLYNAARHARPQVRSRTNNWFQRGKKIANPEGLAKYYKEDYRSNNIWGDQYVSAITSAG
jgi:hypothetical protein